MSDINEHGFQRETMRFRECGEQGVSCHPFLRIFLLSESKLGGPPYLTLRKEPSGSFLII